MIASLTACMRVALAAAALTTAAVPAAAQQQPEAAPVEQAQRGGGEASLVLPPLDLVDVGGYNGRTLLLLGLGV